MGKLHYSTFQIITVRIERFKSLTTNFNLGLILEEALGHRGDWGRCDVAVIFVIRRRLATSTQLA